jgi:L,D-peptidoglycan transpeptidase YkuD (ErfK/YbiS/YcfS/YnhG family)
MLKMADRYGGKRHGLLSPIATVLISTGCALWSPLVVSPQVSASVALANSCHTDQANNLSEPTRVRQLITVVSPTKRSTHATVTMWIRIDNCFQRVGGSSPARVGYNGLSLNHREGDGTTPIGVFSIEPTIYGINPNPGLSYSYHRLICGDWWSEDPSSPAYNRFVHLKCANTSRLGGNSERLWLEAPAYNYFAVIGYNTHPIYRGAGSAIFLHVDTGSSTNGCVSLSQQTLLKVLQWLSPKDDPRIAISTTR